SVGTVEQAVGEETGRQGQAAGSIHFGPSCFGLLTSVLTGYASIWSAGYGLSSACKSAGSAAGSSQRSQAAGGRANIPSCFYAVPARRPGVPPIPSHRPFPLFACPSLSRRLHCRHAAVPGCDIAGIKSLAGEASDVALESVFPNTESRPAVPPAV